MSINRKIQLSAAVLLLFLFAALPSIGQTSVANEVMMIELDDATINPVTAEYITQSIEKAANDKAQCLIIKLDTPGGLLTSTRSIVKSILTAKVPVVVYIAPSGSRAGSAGVFITYASHVAAMAPSTNIGAAHPVQMGGKQKGQENFWEGLKKMLEESKKAQGAGKGASKEKESEEELIHPDTDPMSSKILQDTTAFIRAIAKKRNRNLEWAVKSVAESSSVTETEAKDLGVIEIIADDVHNLLDQLDGREVVVGEAKVVLATKNARVNTVEMDSRQQFFNVLANPNIAYILMILGFYGLLYEITHPGIGVPGIMGAMFLILAFFSMQTLPTNYAGLALILLGLVLLVSEAFVPGFGLLTLGGAVSLILGSMLLYDSSNPPMMRVSMSLILAFTLTTSAITVFLVSLAVNAYRKKKLGGADGIIGEKGEAQTSFSKGKDGKVFVHGEIWNAISDEEIKKGDKIQVVEIDGMTIKVKGV